MYLTNRDNFHQHLLELPCFFPDRELPGIHFCMSEIAAKVNVPMSALLAGILGNDAAE